MGMESLVQWSFKDFNLFVKQLELVAGNNDTCS